MSSSSTPKFWGDLDVWFRITDRVSKAKKSQVVAAIAFIGTEATEILPLKDGDILVCDAYSRSTSAKALKEFHDGGVKVFDHPGLHAKVVVLRSRAFVGSGNASRNSQENLHEAALETTDPVTVRLAREFVMGKNLEVDRLTGTMLEDLAAKEGDREPRRGRGARKEIPCLPETVSRLWIWETEMVNVDHLYPTAERESPGYKRKSIRTGAGPKIDWNSWDPDDSTRLREGDWLIRVDHGQSRIRVLAPVKILGWSEHSDSESILWHAIPKKVHKWRSLTQMSGTVIDKVVKGHREQLVPTAEISQLLDLFRR